MLSLEEMRVDVLIDNGDARVRIVPIPAYGTKRLELEYRQRVTVNDWKQIFLLPLKPDAYQKQRAKHFSLRFEVKKNERFVAKHDGALVRQTITYAWLR